MKGRKVSFAIPKQSDMKCIHCGKEIPDGSKFCKFCGEEQIVEPPVATSPKAPAQARLSAESAPVPVQTTVSGNNSSHLPLLAICGLLGIAVVVIVLISVGNSTQSKNSQSINSASAPFATAQTESSNESTSSNTVTGTSSAGGDVDYFTGSTSAFKVYYLSYLDAINSLDSNLITNCTEEQRQRQAERISTYNSDYVFSNNSITVDSDSFTYGYENGYLVAHFNAKIDNTGKSRESGETFSNTPFLAVTAQYDYDTGVWIITNTSLDPDKTIGPNQITL
jgi:hypothetical protein